MGFDRGSWLQELAWLRHYKRPRFLHHFPGVSEDWFCSLSGSPEDVTSMPTYRVVDKSLGNLESHPSIVVAFLLGDRGTCFYQGLKGSNRDYRLRLAFLCLIATVVMRGTIWHYSLSSGGRISVGLPVGNTLKSAFCDSERRYCDRMRMGTESLDHKQQRRVEGQRRDCRCIWREYSSDAKWRLFTCRTVHPQPLPVLASLATYGSILIQARIADPVRAEPENLG